MRVFYVTFTPDKAFFACRNHGNVVSKIDKVTDPSRLINGSQAQFQPLISQSCILMVVCLILHHIPVMAYAVKKVVCTVVKMEPGH